MEMLAHEGQTNELKEVLNKLILDSIGKEACLSIYLFPDVFIGKVKIEDQVWVEDTHGIS